MLKSVVVQFFHVIILSVICDFSSDAADPLKTPAASETSHLLVFDSKTSQASTPAAVSTALHALSSGSLQACVLSPLLYTHDCIPAHHSNTIVKITGNATHCPLLSQPISCAAMSLRLVLMMSAGVALLACTRRGVARVRLNSIRTVILNESHALPVNRTAWGPGVDLSVSVMKGCGGNSKRCRYMRSSPLYQCMSDLECAEGNYCHIPTKGPAHSRCQTCRRRNRRCKRDSMCQVGNPCLRSSDCSDSLCCARHFWTRICKPVLREGQVCTRQRRKGHQGSELFQRCSCGEGLTCRTVRDPNNRTPPPSSTLLQNEAIKSKSAASPSLSRHSSPHTSMLSTALSSTLGKSSAVVAKTRLHMCQRK
ncbi:hypothetical protein XENOCAPTIV_002708 [Xenoophorus captivus]|uniref:TNFR-Cys domain-containing protein n=1 Tax=Xenoophorus captivus TaxID=1517983 RepID=A0ABV0SCX7_9TELE